MDPPAIVERIRRAIEAEAALAVADGVASAADIDLALRLGAGHPGR
jgi:3-hydroxyacyl-CoA dehydrogenase